MTDQCWYLRTGDFILVSKVWSIGGVTRIEYLDPKNGFFFTGLLSQELLEGAVYAPTVTELLRNLGVPVDLHFSRKYMQFRASQKHADGSIGGVLDDNAADALAAYSEDGRSYW